MGPPSSTLRSLLEEPDGEGGLALFGLESETISIRRLATAAETEVTRILSHSRNMLKIGNLRQVERSIKDLILLKVTHPHANSGASQE